MNTHFIFVSDEEVIERLKQKSTQEEFRNNVLRVSGEESKKFFNGDGYLVYAKWLEEKGEGDIYETGVDGVSYNDLCNYGAEFEAKHGPCPGMEEDHEFIQYQLELVQYCIDRSHGNA